MQPRANVNIRKLIIRVGALVVIFMALWWLMTHSYVDISAGNKSSGNVTYRLLSTSDQKDQKEVVSDKQNVKRLLKRGHYQVEVTQGNRSYVSTFTTGAIFQKTKVTGTLSVEKSREFVGDNPGYCMLIVNAVLLSNECRGQYSEIKTHMPATNDMPTYTLYDTGSILANVEGFVTTPEGSFVLVLLPVSESAKTHVLYKLSADGSSAAKVTRVADITGLSTANTYSVQAYKSGFILYDSDYSAIYYYPSIKSKVEPINVGTPDNKGLLPNQLAVAGDNISLLYTNITESEKVGAKNIKAEVLLINGSEQKRLTLKKDYTSASSCGTQKLCLLRGQQLDVYDTTGKPVLLYSLYNVREIVGNTNGRLTLVTRQGLLGLDTDKRTGAYLYSFGKYTYNASAKDTNGYIVNVTASKGEKVALFIDTSKDDSGSIDKKVYGLNNLSEITAMSVYKNRIFITPYTGDLVFDESTGFFGINQTTKNESNTKINQAIAGNGIDTKSYTIINTAH